MAAGGDGRRFWKTELPYLANQTGLEIEVHPYPEGCSKWNRAEHRLFFADQ